MKLIFQIAAGMLLAACVIAGVGGFIYYRADSARQQALEQRILEETRARQQALEREERFQEHLWVTCAQWVDDLAAKCREAEIAEAACKASPHLRHKCEPAKVAREEFESDPRLVRWKEKHLKQQQ